MPRVWLKGERAGTTEVVADNLPGFPDNIRTRPDGGFYVGLCGFRWALLADAGTVWRIVECSRDPLVTVTWRRSRPSQPSPSHAVGL